MWLEFGNGIFIVFVLIRVSELYEESEEIVYVILLSEKYLVIETIEIFSEKFEYLFFIFYT